MVQILEDEPSFGQLMARGGGKALGSALQGGLEGHMQKRAQNKENEALQKMLGEDFSGISPDLKKTIISEKLKGTRAKKEDDLGKFKLGLDTLGEMKSLVEQGNLGRGSAFKGFFGGETAQDRARFRQLGTSLIPLVAAGVPIRNRLEFEEYKKTITDPSSQEAELIGAIEGLERIFSQKLDAGEGREASGERIKFDMSNPEHKSRRDEVLRKTKGDRKKAQMVLEKEFEL